MPGGLMQLSAYGAQDFYLTGNPQISYFKTVYRRYTNFSMENYRINPQGNLGLTDNDTTNYRFEIKRNGDLISDMYLVFDLPSIYSDNGTQFKWIKNIGFNIINRVTVYIGGSLIDENYGEWFDIWNELTLPQNKKDQFNEMIGNVPELYDPSSTHGYQTYPSSSINSTIPSIQGRKIRVPLIFWFNRNYSLAIPLVSLQYMPLEINVELRKITDLYTVIDINEANETYGCRIKPLKTVADYNRSYALFNFVNDNSFDLSAGEGNSKTIKNFNINIYLDVNFIFLETEEMKLFAKSEHKYLIQQVRQSSFQGSIGNDTLELLVHHPTSFMVVVAKRSDIENRNDWNNYTNWIDEDIPPWSDNFNNEFYEEYYDDTNSSEILNTQNFSFRNSPNILKSLKLKLNGADRFAEQEPEYFNRIIPFKYAKSIPKKGIMMYSFGVNPLDYQPSGSCNFSRFNSIEVFLETQEVPIPQGNVENMYKYDINVYTVNYNILRIANGIGNVEFSN